MSILAIALQQDNRDKLINPPSHFVFRQLHLQTDVAASEYNEIVEDKIKITKTY